MPDIIKPKRRRNDSETEVYGISAPKGFWDEVDKRMRRTGQNRSNLIVDACASQWGLNNVAAKQVGRPAKKKKG